MSRRVRVSAGVVPGPVPVVLGSTPQLRPAKRRTGPEGTDQAIHRRTCATIDLDLDSCSIVSHCVEHTDLDAKPPTAVRQSVGNQLRGDLSPWASWEVRQKIRDLWRQSSPEDAGGGTISLGQG